VDEDAVSARASRPPNPEPVRGRAASIGFPRRLRRDVGAGLEYLWELSGSLRLARADALLLEGKERESGIPLTAFYFGHYDNYEFVFRRIFSDFRIVEKHERIQSLFVGRWLERYQQRASLVLLDVELLYCKLLSTRSYLEIPQWIRQKYRMPETWKEVLGTFRKNTKRVDLRKVRKFGLSYRITREERDFEEFYHRMYVPYLTKRFEGEVIIEPEWKVRRQCRKGEIMQILRGEQVVAAVLLHCLDGRLAYVWVGVPEDLDDELYAGAFSGMYYFTIQYGFQCGCHEIDFLGSRPLLTDGLFRYKRKWGTFVEDSPVPRGDILLKPLEVSEPVKNIFRRNYFIVRDGNSLAAKVLLAEGPGTSERLQGVFDQYFTEGLARLKVFSLAGFEEEAWRWAEESGEAIQLVDLRGVASPQESFCRD
jgi:hypothetical protein